MAISPSAISHLSRRMDGSGADPTSHPRNNLVRMQNFSRLDRSSSPCTQKGCGERYDRQYRTDTAKRDRIPAVYPEEQATQQPRSAHRADVGSSTDVEGGPMLETGWMLLDGLFITRFPEHLCGKGLAGRTIVTMLLRWRANQPDGSIVNRRGGPMTGVITMHPMPRKCPAMTKNRRSEGANTAVVLN